MFNSISSWYLFALVGDNCAVASIESCVIYQSLPPSRVCNSIHMRYDLEVYLFAQWLAPSCSDEVDRANEVMNQVYHEKNR